MYFLSRSSRATGPKIRVPRGAPLLSIRTAGILVELDVAAVSATNFLLNAHDDTADDVALLNAAVGHCLLDAADDDVAEARVTALGAAQDLDALHLASAGVVGNARAWFASESLLQSFFRSFTIRNAKCYLAFSTISRRRQRFILDKRTGLHNGDGVADDQPRCSRHERGSFLVVVNHLAIYRMGLALVNLTRRMVLSFARRLLRRPGGPYESYVLHSCYSNLPSSPKPERPESHGRASRSGCGRCPS